MVSASINTSPVEMFMRVNGRAINHMVAEPITTAVGTATKENMKKERSEAKACTSLTMGPR